MNKVLVEVYVPSANLTYDAGAISDLSDGKYRRGREVTICNFSTGKEYDKNLRVFEANIDNGTKIMII